MRAKALDIDDLDSGALSRFENAFQGLEAYVEKNGARIDAMDEIRGYVNGILKAQVEARIDVPAFSTRFEEPESGLDRMETQTQGGLNAAFNVAMLSSLLIAQQIKAAVGRRNRNNVS